MKKGSKNIMQTTIYQCDRCKQSKSQDDLCKIKVQTQGIRIKERGFYNELNVDICKDCLEKKGFIVNPKPELSNDDVENKNSKTLENKLLEILEDLGVQFYE